MKPKEALTKYPAIMYVVAGALVGMYLGYDVLPEIMPKADAPLSAEELRAVVAAQQQLEAKLAASVVAIDGVSAAKVQLSTPITSSGGHREASVTVTSASPLSEVQVAAIADQVASGVEGLEAGSITIIDAAGRTLNLRTVQEYAQKQFWTGIAANVSKVLGIIVALITMRYIVQAVHKKLLGELGR